MKLEEITKDLWRTNPEKMVGVWVKYLMCYKVKISHLRVGVNTNEVVGFSYEGGRDQKHFLSINDFEVGLTEVITPEEEPELYGNEPQRKENPKPRKQRKIRVETAPVQLTNSKVDVDYPNCDFTKPMWLDVGYKDKLVVDPDDIIIVRKNQVCFINRQTDSLQDAMVQDFTNTPPVATLQDLKVVLSKTALSKFEMIDALIKTGVMLEQSDYSDTIKQLKESYPCKL